MTWGRFTPNIILFPFSVPDTFSTLLRFAVKTFCVCHKKKNQPRAYRLLRPAPVWPWSRNHKPKAEE